jgi:energy-coupling factor transporter ATP-binding protein EcfA2
VAAHAERVVEMRDGRIVRDERQRALRATAPVPASRSAGA